MEQNFNDRWPQLKDSKVLAQIQPRCFYTCPEMCHFFCLIFKKFNSYFCFVIYLVQEVDSIGLTSGEDISHLLGKSTTQHLQNKSVLSKIEVKYVFIP